MKPSPILELFDIYETKQQLIIIGSNEEQTVFKIVKISRWIYNDITKYLEDWFFNIFIDQSVYTLDSIRPIKFSLISFSNAKLIASCVFGIAGFMKLKQGYNIVLITERSMIAKIGDHRIYKADETRLIYLPALISNDMSTSFNNSTTKPGDEKRYFASFNGVNLTPDNYFSYTYDLSNTIYCNLSYATTPVLDPERLSPCLPPCLLESERMEYVQMWINSIQDENSIRDLALESEAVQSISSGTENSSMVTSLHLYNNNKNSTNNNVFSHLGNTKYNGRVGPYDFLDNTSFINTNNHHQIYSSLSTNNNNNNNNDLLNSNIVNNHMTQPYGFIASTRFSSEEIDLIVKLFEDYFRQSTCPGLAEVRVRLSTCQRLAKRRSAQAVRAKIKRLQCLPSQLSQSMPANISHSHPLQQDSQETLLQQQQLQQQQAQHQLQLQHQSLLLQAQHNLLYNNTNNHNNILNLFH